MPVRQWVLTLPYRLRYRLAWDGVFAELTPGRLQFCAATPPSDAAVAQVLATIRHRVRRLLARRGLEPDAAEPSPPDGLAEVSPLLAQLLSASVAYALVTATMTTASGLVSPSPRPATGSSCITWSIRIVTGF